MKKRILSLLLALMLVIGLLPSAYAARTDSGLKYTICEDHVEITGYVDYAPDVIIPSEIEGLPVTTIAASAFEQNYNIRTVTLPDTITTIGNRAFALNSYLSDFSIPDSVTSIGDDAFRDCSGLTSIFIPASVTSIGERAFLGCTNVTGYYVDADNLNYCNDDLGVLFDKEMIELINAPTTISGAYTIPDGVTSIDVGAFQNCAGLTSISIPQSVSFIGTSAFADCTGLTEVVIPEGVTNLTGFSSCTNLAFVSIPASVTSIDTQCFYDCSSLNNVILPENLTTIGVYAFWKCTSMTSITIPASVTLIGSRAFRDCTRLEIIRFEGNAPKRSSSDTLFSGVHATAYYPENDETWTTYVQRSYGGTITWVAYDPSHTHEYASTVTDPTCTEPGFTTYTCTICGDRYADHIDALGHDLSEWETVTAPTCTEDGSESRSCSRCDYVEERVNEATGHSHKAAVTAPTCTEQGYTTYTCECGDSYVADYTDALGHELGDWTIVSAPTCTENGTEQRVCSRCDYTEERVTEATGHSHEAVVTAPTCTEQGFTTYTCACGDSYVTDYTEALGHEYEDGVCIRCGAEKPVENPFTDVPAGSFYEAPVLWAVENGITNGLSATEFGPNATCNRAQVVTFLWRAAGCPEPASTENPFVDVAAGSFYEKPVLWAVENGITNGADATHFNPNGDCNRAQVVTFLYRAFKSPEVTTEGLPFTDVPAGAWYEAPIAWAVENGITNGLTATEFGPNSSCNRAQVVTFLYRSYCE